MGITKPCSHRVYSNVGEVPPSRFTVHEIVKKFETTGSVANKKQNRKHTVLTEETLDEQAQVLNVHQQNPSQN